MGEQTHESSRAAFTPIECSVKSDQMTMQYHPRQLKDITSPPHDPATDSWITQHANIPNHSSFVQRLISNEVAFSVDGSFPPSDRI